MDLNAIKKEVCDAGVQLCEMGLTVGTWGNISARIDDDYMYIKPSGIDYYKLAPCDMVKVNIHDLSYEGNLKPSTETPLHAAIYAARPNINAVIHNHSTNACIVAAAHKDIPPILDDMVQIVGGSIRVSKYGLPGSDELTKNGMMALEGRNAAILANHGPVCIGRNMKEAFVICQIVEKAARVFVDVQALGGPVCISDENVQFMRSFFLEEYGQKKEG